MGPFFKRQGPWLIVAALILLSSWLRTATFLRTDRHSIDEIVYFNLGAQLKEHPAWYNTVQLGKLLIEQDGGELPEYFLAPLFKHPPVFSFLITGMMHLAGEEPLSGMLVSMLAGAGLIWLTYALGSLAAGPRVGVLAAIVMTWDPVLVMSSQKIWMDTTLGFFMLLTVYWFLRGLRGGTFYFWMAGVSGGLAAMTKYPGILAVLSIFGYLLVNRRDLFKVRAVQGMFLLPVLLSLPWLWWNHSIYGADFLSRSLGLHVAVLGFADPRLVYFVGLPALLCAAWWLGRRQFSRARQALLTPYFQRKLQVVWVTALAVLFFPQILLSLQANVLPVSSEYLGLFDGEGVTFYCGKLIEYSLLYFFAWVAFGFRLSDDDTDVLLKCCAGAIIFFVTIWGGYQSRYVIPAIPFLVILGVWSLALVYEKGWDHPSLLLRGAARLAITAAVISFVVRSYAINTTLSAANLVCYF